MIGSITVNIGGKDRLVKFGMIAFEQIVSLSNDKVSKVRSTAVTIYAGLINAHEITGEKLDFTFSDVYAWVDDLFCSEEGAKTILAIDACFTQSQAYKNLIEPLLDKKKEAGKSPKK